MRFIALIPAAGTGTRLAQSTGTADDHVAKQYRRINGQPMIEYSLQVLAACAAITQTYVVTAADDHHYSDLGLAAYATALPVGGPTRHASVLNALDALKAIKTLEIHDDDWILVHDAARPGLSTALVAQFIETLRDDAVGGLLALPMADTLKNALTDIEGVSRAQQTVPREHLWQAQTPQMFRYGLLRRALHAALVHDTPVTDEASAIEALGLHPRLVLGSACNFKVTHSDDLALAALLLRPAHDTIKIETPIKK